MHGRVFTQVNRKSVSDWVCATPLRPHCTGLICDAIPFANPITNQAGAQNYVTNRASEKKLTKTSLAQYGLYRFQWPDFQC